MEQAQPPVAPSLKDTCQAARYAFEAYNAPGTSPTYASGSTGVAEVVFMDQSFIERGNTGNGGILVVELTDALALKPFCGVSLSVELCIQPRILRAAAAATAAKGEQQQGSIRGAAIHVSLPLKGQDKQIVLGVRDKTKDLLHLTLYYGNEICNGGVPPEPVHIRIPLTDVGANRSTKVVPMQALLREAATAANVAGSSTSTNAGGNDPAAPNQMSFTWLLAPFSDNPFAGKNILPREQPLVKIAHDIMSFAFKFRVDFADINWGSIQELPSRKSQEKVNWDELSRKAGAEDLTLLAYVNCPDTDTVWIAQVQHLPPASKGICRIDDGSTPFLVWFYRNDSCGKVMVSFRGTETDSLANMLTNANLFLTPPDDLNPLEANGLDGNRLEAHDKRVPAVTPAADTMKLVSDTSPKTFTPPQVLVHTGFLRAYMSIRATIMSILDLLIFDQQDPAGGALATLATYDLSARKQEGVFTGDILCYTFGSPRVGNLVFMNEFNKLASNAWRLTNTKDLIPRVPDRPLLQGARDPNFKYYHVAAHWDLQTAENDPKARVGPIADSGPHRLPVPSTLDGIREGIEAHLEVAYYNGLCKYPKLKRPREMVDQAQPQAAEALAEPPTQQAPAA
ncbi:hypothetical protein VOLCADRAFT_90228 [Volvox carteri f. nagariensis]|uniref:Fungal lipase-type domain-containing protein n=1 Tax=Volvox carteri f. nagariensis TaxID=3068 RepID=D8TTT6_VOLCA|nr:uncharacterized protein VOLCADRAFT_90228 [Volvox carteri f. nagariensis]EFJ49025.1 hypothetical protein VOLCADRAFT_90228 [Volvox carteri f. nagariensis]|eukprot:XP_002949922.1 hypothetical protein VOLCADRAFT_90228 [Volvox carteri f. nagariensis]